MRTTLFTVLAVVATLVVGSTMPVRADDSEASPLGRLTWRNVGPVNMGGRVSDVEGIPGDPRIVYVGAASGGVWKSTDGGVTFEPIFDDQPVASIGDIALAPSNPEVVYVGTGEDNVRNSVSYGNGVYRSNDGGETWHHVGLEDTQTIGRVAVHPTDPDTVFVAAIGPIYGPSAARGVFRSRDGGGSWERVLSLDDDHGAADVEIDPSNPNIMFATLWKFRRQPWTFTSGSDDGGVWRSRDGGSTWEKLETGLPKTMGRVAVKVAPSNPRVVYVIAESNDGILFRSDDRGDTFERINDDVDLVSRGFYYTDLRVDPTDENRVFAIASRLFRSRDGGRSFERIARSVHIDFHGLWIDPENPRRIWTGEDGGVAVSHDGGDAWLVPRNLPIGQFYQVFYGMESPFYTVGGGLQDNGTWHGPSRTREPAGILPDDWRMMSFGDAYFVVQHPEQHHVFISESQAGGILRTDVHTRQQTDISPQPRRNDGGPAGELEYRFNWNSPIVASPHDPMTVYFCGNVVFRSRDFGETWKVISPDLTTDDPEKQGEAGGPVWPENTTAEYHTTIISFAESPVEAGTLWVGTDDGKIQLSRDAGDTWTDLTSKRRGGPSPWPVSHLEPSRTAGGTVYASFDRHMFDDFAAHVYRTEDYGASWTQITDGLEDAGWVWVVREDPVDHDVLYAGTELGLWASWNGGAQWERLHLENLPAVSVHDVLIHPRDNDLILGTHGRGIWIFDDATPIQRLPSARDQAAHLFAVRPAYQVPRFFTRYGVGDQAWIAPNPPNGALITYALAEALTGEPGAEGEARAAEGEVGDEAPAAPGTPRLRLEILDQAGAVVCTIDDLSMEQGLHRVVWDLRHDPPVQRSDAAGPLAEWFGPPAGPWVLPGLYTARLTLDGEPRETEVEVRLDPQLDLPRAALEARHATAMRIHHQIGAANRGLRALDRLREQVAARRETRSKMWDEDDGLDPVIAVFDDMDAAIQEELSLWTRVEGKPFWSQGPELSDLLDRLGGSIDGQLRQPTAAQDAYAAALVDEAAHAIRELDAFLMEEVPSFNEQLAEHGVPGVAVPALVGE